MSLIGGFSPPSLYPWGTGKCSPGKPAGRVLLQLGVLQAPAGTPLPGETPSVSTTTTMGQGICSKKDQASPGGPGNEGFPPPGLGGQMQAEPGVTVCLLWGAFRGGAYTSGRAGTGAVRGGGWHRPAPLLRVEAAPRQRPNSLEHLTGLEHPIHLRASRLHPPWSILRALEHLIHLGIFHLHLPQSILLASSIPSSLEHPILPGASQPRPCTSLPAAPLPALRPPCRQPLAHCLSRQKPPCAPQSCQPSQRHRAGTQQHRSAG